jgi:hypothetical protein
MGISYREMAVLVSYNFALYRGRPSQALISASLAHPQQALEKLLGSQVYGFKALPGALATPEEPARITQQIVFVLPTARIRPLPLELSANVKIVPVALPAGLRSLTIREGGLSRRAMQFIVEGTAANLNRREFDRLLRA